jgi:hypothetical protein
VSEKIKATGMLFKDGVLHLFETADGLRAFWDQVGCHWSQVAWLNGVELHRAGEVPQEEPRVLPAEAEALLRCRQFADAWGQYMAAKDETHPQFFEPCVAAQEAICDFVDRLDAAPTKESTGE